MKLLRDEYRWGCKPTVVALGTFDGVHVGHKALIARTRNIAKEQGLASLVFTFATHPLNVLRPGGGPPALMTPAEKVLAIAEVGPDALVLRHFDKGLANLTPEAFAQHLADTLCPRHVVVGFNYSFGQGGGGDPTQLAQFGQAMGFQVHCLPAVMVGGLPVSSTRVRAAVLAGDMAAATQLLGEPYTLCGTVIQGKHLGRDLGYPTANLALPQDKALPPFGVYAARVRVGGQEHPAVLNMGLHPSAPEGGATIEVHILDAAYDLYGRRMRVRLNQFLRPEQRFNSLEALRAQIEGDVQQARAFFREPVG